MPRESDIDLPQGATIGKLLEILCARHEKLYGEIFEAPETLRPLVNVLKNGRNVFFTGNLATPLEDGDVIAVFPPIAGG